jgi:hypothetical protein
MQLLFRTLFWSKEQPVDIYFIVVLNALSALLFIHYTPFPRSVQNNKKKNGLLVDTNFPRVSRKGKHEP